MWYTWCATFWGRHAVTWETLLQTVRRVWGNAHVEEPRGGNRQEKEPRLRYRWLNCQIPPTCPKFQRQWKFVARVLNHTNQSIDPSILMPLSILKSIRILCLFY